MILKFVTRNPDGSIDREEWKTAKQVSFEPDYRVGGWTHEGRMLLVNNHDCYFPIDYDEVYLYGEGQLLACFKNGKSVDPNTLQPKIKPDKGSS